MRQQRTNQPISSDSDTELICFSHLRWGFVYQRPQHLMSRFAKHWRVFFIEEAVFDDDKPGLRINICPKTGVHVVVPVLPDNLPRAQRNDCLSDLITGLISDKNIRDYVVWFYTPMALDFARELQPVATVYDCMDELSLFRGAPPELIQKEKELLAEADLVFTGGLSLFESKCEEHSRVHSFPSSVDVPHFAQARRIANEPPDQKDIPHPRIGYAGVIDERLDVELIANVAEQRPDWQIVMIGPVVKISAASLPRRGNIHYLGIKPYSDLPAYFSAWDAAMLPFALNDATRFISPTKTPEYLAAGLPVISTPIRDVIRPYGELGLVHIAKSSSEFTAAMDKVMTFGMSFKWRERADAFLSTLSWDATWNEMNDLILSAIAARRGTQAAEENAPLQAMAAGAVNV
jgi:UDP-galactopyranose mutase